jgi:hypothetical protein
MTIQTYSSEIEAQMRNFYNSLSEKDRRRYAAIEATKLGHGGVGYVCRLFSCDDRTISRGKQELKSGPFSEKQRIRKPGGGRKSILATVEGLDDAFLEVVKNHTAGSPMDETIKWTNLSRSAIAEKLKEHNFSVSVTVVDQLLKKHHFHSCQAFKSEAGKKNIPQRDEQFKNIERLKQKYNEEGHPVLSMDVKKKN